MKGKKIFSFGFSLVEIMIILISISIILSALVPLMQKNLKQTTQTAFSDLKLRNYKTDCTSDINSHCLMCEKKTKVCIVCDLGCACNQTLNISKCICE